MLTNKINISRTNIVDGYVNIPLSCNFSPETQQYDDIEKNFNLTTSDIITPTVDYEKIKAHPIGSFSYSILNEGGNFEMMEDGNNSILEFYDISYLNGLVEHTDSINFRLHFINTGETNGWDIGSTKITNVGFTEDDIKKKKSNLTNTFIRLSFYDSDNLKLQNLLYYSTIYLDVDNMYSKYINDNLSTTGLTTEFVVQNPKLSNKIKSFEGFNVYLFKGDIIKDQIKTIYMRIDFNNASNGKSILFTKGKPDTSDGYKMQQLYENLFYKQYCFYDKIEKKYVYYFDGIPVTIGDSTFDEKVKKVVNLDLYQAKVI